MPAARSRSVRAAPAPCRALPVTGAAAHCRPSPTPTWCLGVLPSKGFWAAAARCSSTLPLPARVLGELGAQLGLSAEEAALGVVRVANATMERALRTVSVEQGYDPRQLHAAALWRRRTTARL